MIKYLLFLLFTFCCLGWYGQDYPTVQRMFWGTGVDQFYNGKLLQSGRVVLLGRTDSHRNGGYQNKDGWVVMLSSTGDTLWSKAYGGESRTDRFWDVEETGNGDLMLVGSSGSFFGSENMYWVKTDSLGNLLSSFNYGGKGYETAHDIELLPDGGWLMVGESKLDGDDKNSPFHIMLVRCDSTGYPVWMKRVLMGEESFGTKVQFINDSIYALGHVKLGDRFYTILLGLHMSGELMFAKTYQGGSTKGECSSDMIWGSNGNIYLSGYAIDSTFSGLLMEVTARGKVVNSLAYHTQKDLELLRLQQDDNNLWVVGYSTESSTLCAGALLRLNRELNVEDAQQFRPFNENFYFSSIDLLPNNKMLLVGSHTDQHGYKNGGYVGFLEKEGDIQPFQEKLDIKVSEYPIKEIKLPIRTVKLTEYHSVQSLQVPVVVEVVDVK